MAFVVAATRLLSAVNGNYADVPIAGVWTPIAESVTCTEHVSRPDAARLRAAVNRLRTGKDTVTFRRPAPRQAVLFPSAHDPAAFVRFNVRGRALVQQRTGDGRRRLRAWEYERATGRLHETRQDARPGHPAILQCRFVMVRTGDVPLPPF